MKALTAVLTVASVWMLYNLAPRPATRSGTRARAGGVRFKEERPARKQAETALSNSSTAFRSVHEPESATLSARPEIEEQLAHFHVLGDNLPQLVWIADPPGKVYWYNRRWFEYAGIAPPTKLEEFAWNHLIHPAHAQRFRAKYEKSMALGEPWEDTVPIRGKSGTYRWFLAQLFPLNGDDGRIVGWCGASTDITEQMQAQEALREADRRKDEFIATLAHELRNPLAPVLNAAEILKRTQHSDASVDRMASIIQRQVTQMAKLIDDLLDVARIARGKLELRFVECDLGQIAASTAHDYQESLAVAGIDLQLTLPSEPLPISGDPVRLAQCMGNYLQNAIGFAAGSPISVRVFADLSTNEAVVSVTDHGPGIRPDLLPRLFQPFAQAEQDLARSRGGLGLGLAVTKGLAELHGGRALARSEGENKGATFELRIPLVPRGTPAHSPHAEGATRGKRLKILIIEDNQDAAETLKVLLEREGHDIRLAADGEVGTRDAGSWRPDVVLCDLGLPGPMDGYDVARVLKSTMQASHVRLIALSGYADSAAVERSRDAGFDVHLAKPVDFERLIDELAISS